MSAKEESAVAKGEYVIGIAVILAALLISATVYFSATGLQDAVSKLKLVAPSGGAQPAAAAPTPTQPAPTQAAGPTVYTIPSSMLAASQPKGPASAKVTIVEFSDFQCPFCSRALPMIKAAMDKYPNQVKLYYKHFPLQSLHPNAQKAAEAAECAKDQGKFWEMHDAMFADQNKLAVTDLEATAATLGLDAAKFKSCLEGGSKASIVSKDQQDGGSLGVQGTPTFYINGKQVVGADAQGILAAVDAAIAG